MTSLRPLPYQAFTAVAGIVLMLPLRSISLPLLIVLPGLSSFLLYKNGKELDVHAAVSYALSLSLLIVPAFATILILLNISASLTGLFIGAFITVLSLLSFALQRPRQPLLQKNSAQERRVLILALPIILSLVLALFVSVPLAKTLVVTAGGLVMHPTEASDLNFFLSTIVRFVESPHIPPEDPYLPTYYIVYNWFMHVCVGTLALSSGVNAIVVFKIMIPVLLFALAMNIFVLCREIFNNITGLIAMLLYVLGGGLAWIAIVRFQPTDLFPYLIYEFSDTATIKYDQTVLFYLLPQTETFALVILVFAFVVWVSIIKRLKLKNALLFGLVLGLLPYYHLITAVPLFVAVFVYLAYQYAKNDLMSAKYSALSLLIGGAVALPQAFLLIGGQSQVAVTFSTYSLYFMFLVYGLIALLAMAGVYRARQNIAARPLVYFALGVLVLMGIIALPLTQNTYRFLVFLYLPIAIFASFYIAVTMQTARASRPLSKPTLFKLIAIVFALAMALPSTYLLWQFYNDEKIQYTLATNNELTALDWVKANTSKDAIFLEEPSTFPRIPLETGRRVAFAGPLYTLQYHGIDLEQQIDSVMDEHSSAALSRELQQLNVSYVFVGPREQQHALATTVKDQSYFDLMYMNPAVTIYKVRTP